LSLLEIARQLKKDYEAQPIEDIEKQSKIPGVHKILLLPDIDLDMAEKWYHRKADDYKNRLEEWSDSQVAPLSQ
jgi:hypothetical protein